MAVDLPLDIAAEPPPPAEPTRAHAPLPTPTTCEATPLTALHDDRLWQLARRGQGPVLRLDFELHTRLARQVFRRDFAYVSRQMLGLEASRRVQRLDRALLDDALHSVRHRSDDLLAQFTRVAGELDALTRCATDVTQVAVAPAAPVRVRATVLSPSTRRFVELLQAADRVVCRAEQAWLLGALPPARRTAIVGECRRGLAGFKELVRERRHAIGTRVREVNGRDSVGEPRVRSDGRFPA